MPLKTWPELLAEFHEARAEFIPHYPQASVPQPVRMLRIGLMQEELSELMQAMREEDEVEILDGLCDLLYVVLGTANAYGMGPILDAAFREVHRSNMTKNHQAIKEGLKYGPHGKGEFYEPPNLQQFFK